MYQLSPRMLRWDPATSIWLQRGDDDISVASRRSLSVSFMGWSDHQTSCELYFTTRFFIWLLEVFLSILDIVCILRARSFAARSKSIFTKVFTFVSVMLMLLRRPTTWSSTLGLSVPALICSYITRLTEEFSVISLRVPSQNQTSLSRMPGLHIDLEDALSSLFVGLAATTMLDNHFSSFQVFGWLRWLVYLVLLQYWRLYISNIPTQVVTRPSFAR